MKPLKILTGMLLAFVCVVPVACSRTNQYTATACLRVTPPQIDVYAPSARNWVTELEDQQQAFVREIKGKIVLAWAIEKDQNSEGKKLDRIRGTSFFTGELDSTVALLQEKLVVSIIKDT
ncbi:MAG: hypothetical protein GY794_18720, partial [bacterium]|nr:hypothetical protein [bacterium]